MYVIETPDGPVHTSDLPATLAALAAQYLLEPAEVATLRDTGRLPVSPEEIDANMWNACECEQTPCVCPHFEAFTLTQEVERVLAGTPDQPQDWQATG